MARWPRPEAERGSFGLIFVRHHDGDSGLWFVDVERTASGNELYEFCSAVIVAHVERNGNTVATWAAAEDGKAEHPNDVPQAAGFVLAADLRRHCDISIEHGARDKHGQLDSGFLRRLGDVDLHAIGDGLGSGVGEDHAAKKLAAVFWCGCVIHRF